jgi:hypothetical protein
MAFPRSPITRSRSVNGDDKRLVYRRAQRGVTVIVSSQLPDTTSTTLSIRKRCTYEIQRPAGVHRGRLDQGRAARFRGSPLGAATPAVQRSA